MVDPYHPACNHWPLIKINRKYLRQVIPVNSVFAWTGYWIRNTTCTMFHISWVASDIYLHYFICTQNVICLSNLLVVISCLWMCMYKHTYELNTTGGYKYIRNVLRMSGITITLYKNKKDIRRSPVKNERESDCRWRILLVLVMATKCLIHQPTTYPGIYVINQI